MLHLFTSCRIRAGPGEGIDSLEVEGESRRKTNLGASARRRMSGSALKDTTQPVPRDASCVSSVLVTNSKRQRGRQLSFVACHIRDITLRGNQTLLPGMLDPQRLALCHLETLPLPFISK